MDNEGVVGLLSFLSFGFSVIAAVLAIDTYALLRTGQSGGTWRVLIIASVIFALMQALRLGEILNFAALGNVHLSEVVELVFVIALTYAFYLQRRIFQGKPVRSAKSTSNDAASDEADAEPETEDEAEDEDEIEDEIEPLSSEWARLNGLPTGGDHPRGSDDDGTLVTDRRSTDRRSTNRRGIS